MAYEILERNHKYQTTLKVEKGDVVPSLLYIPTGEAFMAIARIGETIQVGDGIDNDTNIEVPFGNSLTTPDDLPENWVYALREIVVTQEITLFAGPTKTVDDGRGYSYVLFPVEDIAEVQ